MPTPTTIRVITATTAALLALTLGACSTTPTEDTRNTDAAAAFPVAVTNCSNDITFDEAPERIVVFRNEVVPVLSSLGVLDRVVGTVGRFHDAYFDADTAAQLDEIPSLSDNVSAVGGGEISLEDVLAVEPDLVIGTSETVTRDALLAQGVQVLENEESCEGSQATSTLADIDTLFGLYADVFDRHDEADAALADIDEQIATAQELNSGTETRTAAMLYPTLGGGPAYAYGAGSMNHTLLELAGFENVFADSSERTIEISTEELLDRDPDVLILLHSGATDEEVTAAVTALPGADGLTAVRTGELMPLLFGFTSPASPITINGLDLIVERFQG